VGVENELSVGGTMTATSTVGSCTVGQGIVSCTLGNMAIGATANISITAQLAGSGPSLNVASIAGAQGDPNTTNNRAEQPITVTALPPPAPPPPAVYETPKAPDENKPCSAASPDLGLWLALAALSASRVRALRSARRSSAR
jgi:hypothetical protein